MLFWNKPKPTMKWLYIHVHGVYIQFIANI